MSDANLEHCDNHLIVIFCKLMCFDMSDCERAREEKGKQTKTVKCEHCGDCMLLVSLSNTPQKISSIA